MDLLIFCVGLFAGVISGIMGTGSSVMMLPVECHVRALGEHENACPGSAPKNQVVLARMTKEVPGVHDLDRSAAAEQHRGEGRRVEAKG